MFTYSPLGKALEKQTKTIEDLGKKQIKAIEVHVKPLIESNELNKNNFNIDRDSTSFKEPRKVIIFFKKGLLDSKS